MGTPYKKWRAGAKSMGILVGALMLAIWSVFPIYWMVSTSLKTEGEWKSVPPVYLPTTVTADNYRNVYREMLFPALTNSIVAAFSASVLATVLGSLSAYALARMRFRFKENIAFWILSTRMLLPVAIIIPLFIFMRSLHLIDSLAAVILMHTVVNLPFAVWMLKGYFAEIPKEMEESAMVDGCSPLGALGRILAPLALPGVMVTFVFCFIFSWNEFLFALIVTQRAAVTIPVQLSKLHQTRGPLWGQIAALGTIAIVPAVVLTASIQRYLVRGLSLGALKE